MTDATTTFPRYRRGDTFKVGALKLTVRVQYGPFVSCSNPTYLNCVYNAISGTISHPGVRAKAADEFAAKFAQNRARRLREEAGLSF